MNETVEVRNLNEMLTYQEGSIVSRVLLKNGGGTVTLFAFEAGEGLSEHTAPFDALLICIEGAADVNVAGAPFRAKAGETLVLPANQPHGIHASERFKMLLVMLKA